MSDDQFSAFRPYLSDLREAAYGDFIDPRERYFDDPTFLAQGLLPGGFSGRMTERTDGRQLPIVQSEADLTEIRGIARMLADTVSPAIGAVKNLKNYIIRQGFTYTVRPHKNREAPTGLVEAVQQVIDELREQNDFDGDLDRELLDRAVCDGEYFLAMYPQEGRTQLRIVEPEMVREPTNVREVEEWLGWQGPCCDWSFGVQTEADDIQRVHGYFVQWTNNPADFDYLPGHLVEHVKVNVYRNIKRGLTDFYPVAVQLLDATKALRNIIKGVSLQAAIAWIMEGAPGTSKSQMETLRGGNAVGRYEQAIQGGGQTRFVEEYRAGTVLRVPSGQQYKSGPLGSERVPNFVGALSAVMRFISARWCMPEYMLSADASNANYASTLVAESPFVKNCEAEQAYYVSRFRRIMWKGVMIAEAAGRFREFGLSFGQIKSLVEISIDPPQVSTRNPTEEETIRKMRSDAGVLSKKTWASEVGLDYEAEQENKASEPQPAAIPLAAKQPSIAESRRPRWINKRLQDYP